MSDEKPYRKIVIGGLVTFLFGALTFYLQQHYKARELADDRNERVTSSRAAALRDYSAACADLAGAATEMERESRLYLSDREGISADSTIAAMDRFLKQLVRLQGIDGATAPLFNLEHRECAASAAPSGSPLDTHVDSAIARAHCEVSLCNEQLNSMSSYLRSN